MTRELKEGDKVRLGRTLTICEATPGHDWVGVQLGIYDGHPIRTTMPRDWLVPTTKPSLADAEPAEAPEQRPMFKVGDKVRWRNEGPDAEPFTVDAILGNRVRIQITDRHGLPEFQRIVREDRLKLVPGAAPQAPAPELDDEHDSPLRDPRQSEVGDPLPQEASHVLPGAVVRLKSGGPEMTVDGPIYGEVSRTRCVWFSGHTLLDGEFSPMQLVVLFDRDGHPMVQRDGFLKPVVWSDCMRLARQQVMEDIEALGGCITLPEKAPQPASWDELKADTLRHAKGRAQDIVRYETETAGFEPLGDVAARVVEKSAEAREAEMHAAASKASRDEKTALIRANADAPASFWCDRSSGCSCAMCLDV